ncbi:MAG TPA: sulfurtransferase TusA family protein [Castellaniella sp.]|uniref:sulfurtransferase TusA family protein n=1 Tax=Castellaniella sp. TaxID=1955812 RepID=UPI002F0307DE
MITDVSLDSLQVDEWIDAQGLNCPLPILRTKKALAKLASGQVLAVVTTDPHAVADFQAFCRQTGNALLAQNRHSDAASDLAMVHYIRRR